MVNIKGVQIGMPKGSSKSQDWVYKIAFGIFFVVIVYIIYQIYLGYSASKKLVSNVINIPQAAITASKERAIQTNIKLIPQLSGYTATNTATTPEGIKAELEAQKIFEEAVAQNYNEAWENSNPIAKLGVVIDNYGLGGSIQTSAITSRQNVINALLPLSFANNAGYVEKWIDTLNFFEKLRFDRYETTTHQEIRNALGSEFTIWLNANYDASGNPKSTINTTTEWYKFW